MRLKNLSRHTTIIILTVALSGCGMPATEAPDPTATTPSTTSAAPSTTVDIESSAPTTTSSMPTTTTPLAGAPDSPPPTDTSSGDQNDALPPGAEVATVVSITDGDTFDVMLDSGQVEELRLIGINSPERGECWAEEATSVLESFTPPGTTIGLTTDVSDRDQYGRLLRYVWVGQLFVNEELVRQGAAISRRYPPDTALADRLDAAQEEAHRTESGLWAPDACGDASQADIRVEELFYDAPGNDNENLNAEYIRIRNYGNNPVDLTGWSIRDESASNRYQFPTGFNLGPGEVITVHSGCGDDSGTSLYWCSVGSAIWNNDGDTAFIIDPNGNVHASWSYS